jgi:hypothetical protein
VSESRPTVADSEPLYLVITECLQNDFFLNPSCRLSLPEPVVREMLLGKTQARVPAADGAAISREQIARGPLGLFLEATVGRRRKKADGRGTLHVINIRDWHLPGPSYDDERRLYGRHCEHGTWGARYIEGLEQYLDPGNSSDDPDAAPFHDGSVWVHDVLTDSVADFRPRHDADERTHRGKFRPSALETILDGLIQGHDAATSTVYVAVIGVFTDIKVQVVLVGLRTRYELPNLAVSDTLTASRSLERHLAVLDFMDKVLRIEVVHGLNDLVSFLGGTPSIQNEDELVGGIRFARYSSYFADKQNVLSYEDEKLQQYLALTERRSIRVYELIRRANTALLIWGSLFLLLTLAAGVLKLVEPDQVSWELPVASGATGLLAIVAAFYSRPIRQLQENLNNLAVFRMILESRSLKTAVTRYHLTTPETLRELETQRHAEAAHRQIDALQSQLEVIMKADEVDYQALERLGFRAESDGAGARNSVPGDGSAGAAGEGAPAEAAGS